MTSKTIRLFLTLAGIALTTGAQAHPVAYKGALALMTWNQPFLNDFWATYSFRSDMAISGRAMRMTMKGGHDLYVYFPQYSWLAKRWNRPESQSNVYFYGGAGGATMHGQTGAMALVGVEADSEDRRYFVLGRLEMMSSGVSTLFSHADARVGIAPYEAEYDQVATWFMVQAQYHPALEQDFVVTPLVRLFYQNMLIEGGVSLQGDWMANFMVHL